MFNCYFWPLHQTFMYELVYSSKANKNTDKNAILDILKTAESTNKALDITGCLVFHRNTFVQILEGNKEDIHGLLSKITDDDRHNDIVVLYEGEIKKRSFDSWSMAFHSTNDQNTNEQDTQLFEQNIFQLSQVVDKSTSASFLFWLNVRRQMKGWLA